jgi:3-carboxy-cis,cis-muconate cycloisomerase
VTSQDAMDTGLMLQLRAGLELLEADARELCASLEKLAIEHRATPMAGRTWMQHAVPTTFGLKVAGWLSQVARHVARLGELRAGLVMQLGGAVGTLAAMGEHAEKTVALMAEELKLPAAEMPWHTQRDRVVEIAAAAGILVGTLGKIAGDIALMSQAEVSEVAEPSAPGKGGSSSMPQKRNPVGCASVLATATRVPALVSVMFSAMRQEHERALGGWQAEWETLPEIMMLAGGALGQVKHVIGGLQVDAGRMRANLEITRGQIYAEALSNALGKVMHRDVAQAVVEELSRKALAEGLHLRDAAFANEDVTAHLNDAKIKAVFEPDAHVKGAARLLDQAITAAKERLAGGVR